MKIDLSWALAWLAAVSLMAVLTSVWDKSRARRQKWRVPERTLWLVAVLGGALATYVTMLVIRHKTLHRRFMWGLPLLITVQTVLLFLLWRSNAFIFV